MLQVERPVFIVAAPRSGSTMLFETLARIPGIWTIGGESHDEFERVPGWHPRDRGYDSNRLTAADADASARARLTTAFALKLRDSEGVPWRGRGPAAAREAVRLLEKTPKNALRVPLLKALFPDARFIFLVRDPRDSLSSIMEAWRSGRFVTYRDLPAWPGPAWSLLLPPGWRHLSGAPLERIAAFQWATANAVALDDLNVVPADDRCAVSYETLIASPRAILERLSAFVGIPLSPSVLDAMAKLPVSRHTLTPPKPGKWRDNATAIEAILPEVENVWTRLRAALMTGAA